MTFTEEECAQKWSLINEKLAGIDALIKDLATAHQKSAELENIEVAKLHQAAAYAMTELEKCKKSKLSNRSVIYRRFRL